MYTIDYNLSDQNSFIGWIGYPEMIRNLRERTPIAEMTVHRA